MASFKEHLYMLLPCFVPPLLLPTTTYIFIFAFWGTLGDISETGRAKRVIEEIECDLILSDGTVRIGSIFPSLCTATSNPIECSSPDP